MLALLYLGLATFAGDLLCRRFYRFVSVTHRAAAAFLVGLLLSSWFSYLTACAFAATSKPLRWAVLLFFAAATFTVIFVHRSATNRRVAFIQPRLPGSRMWDFITLAGYLVIASWLMFATLQYHNGSLRIGNNEWSDFGPNTAIARSFSVGHNFPTQYPHFSGEPIRYHFLFYFQAGNLEFLGLNLAWSLNLLSILTLVSMLALVMALGQLLFRSRTIGRIGSALFFVHGTLSFIPFLRSHRSVESAWQAIRTLREFLPSGFTWRGELWGVWTQIVFANQRHFASAIGIFVLVLIFLVDRYQQVQAVAESALAGTAPGEATTPNSLADEQANSAPAQDQLPQPRLRRGLGAMFNWSAVTDPSFLFSGLLLGALPFWNALVFTTALAVLSCCFILLPCRAGMLGLAAVAAAAAFPQIIYLRSGGVKGGGHSLFHWGYIIEQPTIGKVLSYFGFSFGLKSLLIAVALIFASRIQRRLFLAICPLVVLPFSTQISVELLANHKFLNVWLVVANLFVAYGLWRLWQARPWPVTILSRASAIALVAAILFGGIIDLFPIHNGYFVDIPYENDPLVQWVQKQTKPNDLFLSDRFINHQILLAGRRIFYGWPSFPWSAGYDTTKRDRVYTEMFETHNLPKLLSLLHENHISYVAYDDNIRHGELTKKPNEQIYDRYFEKLFQDTGHRYGGLVIYKVPDRLPAAIRSEDLSEPPVSAFEGGAGTGPGRFNGPRGLALDRRGNIFVADSNNSRIEKFTSSGDYVASIGKKGAGYGQLGEPNGIAVDGAGNIYVAEASNHRVQKLAEDGTFLAEWKGPPPGFYGPRRIAIGPDESVYVVDQGRTRIVRFRPDGEVVATWGTKGSGNGQFDDPTSVAVDHNSGTVYVADPRNKRIQVFDAGGTFLAQWLVPEWGDPYGFEDLVVAPDTKRLYASSAHMDRLLVFDLAGSRIEMLQPKPPQKLEGPSALALGKQKLYVLSMSGNRVNTIDLQTK